jgi:hypothetical protein
MAVIIDDFEVVIEPPPAPEEGTETEAESQAAVPAPLLRPHDLAEIERRRMERLYRVWAH